MVLKQLKEIIELLSSVEKDAEKCESGNASAARRLRKACMSATKQLKELRALALEKTRK